jgi:hypothetical protein
MTQFSFEWILSLNCLCQKWGQVQLHPLRLPKSSERLDPPLIDVLIEDGYRKGDINLQEAQFIVTEIKAIVEDPLMARLSIGVVSLLGD